MLKKLIAWTLTLYLAAILVVLYMIERPVTRPQDVPPTVEALPIPDFDGISDIPSRKKAFFGYFRPLVEIQNETLRADREQVRKLALKIQKGETLNTQQKQQLRRFARKYHVLEEDEPLGDHIDDISAELLERVDTIPPALVLAQAANESSWGRSRFAQKGNNYFGQWCFKKGCGMVPNNRQEGAIHEVRSFQSPRESVAAYFNNINSHPAYKGLRELRAQLRARGEEVTGRKLAEGLRRYSERGEAYVEELRTMMRVNSLE